MKRRNFIKISSAGLLAGMLTPRHILANMIPSNKIGLQLYSLRNEIKEDLEGSLKKISDIGYKNLEAAGYSDGKFYGMDPTDFKTLVENLGISSLQVAEEVVPNPLDGFHGPSSANPERRLTLQGGTRLP